MRVHSNDNFGAYLPKVTLRHTIYYICDKMLLFVYSVGVGRYERLSKKTDEKEGSETYTDNSCRTFVIPVFRRRMREDKNGFDRM